MRYCFNLECINPVNNEDNDRCVSCGASLVLSARYVITRLLAQEGFGRMYLGVDLLRGATCAIKQLLPRDPSGVALPPDMKFMFRREAEELRRLGKDPRIPSFIDYIEEGSTQYLVLEYIEGVTLTSLVYDKGTAKVFDEEQLRDFLWQMLSLLEKLHNAGIVERDIKPDNIMLRGGVYVLIDFRRSKSLASATQLTGPLFTASNPSGESDIHRLGVTCLFLLTGKHSEDLHDPYAGKWLWRLFLGQNQVSDTLASVLDRLVAPRSEKGYATTQEVVAALDHPTPPRVSTSRTAVVPSLKQIESSRRYGVMGFLILLGLPAVIVGSMAVGNVWKRLYSEGKPRVVSVTAPSPSPSSSPSPSPLPSASPTSQPSPVVPKIIENSIYRYEGDHLSGLPHGKGVKVTKRDGVKETGTFAQGVFVSGIRQTDKGVVEKGSFKDGFLNTQTGERIYPNKEHEKGVFEEGTFVKGEKTLEDGTYLKGSFGNGKLNGKGLKITSLGRQEGDFVDNRLHGKGKYTLSFGTVMEGDFRDGFLEGEGKIIRQDGDYSIGKFKMGALHGTGKMKSGIHTYEGEFYENTLNGRGKRTSSDGEVLDGEFLKHKLVKGKWSFPDGTVYEGEFKNDHLDWKGKATYPSGEVQEGEFKGGKLNGEGKITFANGSVYEGHFIDAYLNGTGKIVEADGDVWEGEFKDNLLYGTGKVTDSEGQIWEGEFQNDKLNGKGKITFGGVPEYEDGTFVEGTFKNNRLVGKGRMTFPNGTSFDVQGENLTPVNPLDALARRLKKRNLAR